MKTLYYVEKDGLVFLVEKEGRLLLPEKSELPFDVSGEREMAVEGARVLYCTPVLKKHPENWVNKDKIPGLEGVDTLVRQAVNISLVRQVSDAIIIKDNKVLMVKGSRGYSKGEWDLPGGFINFGEDPEQSLVREVNEETGLDISVKELVHLSANMVAGRYFIAFIYLCFLTGGELKLETSEISAAEWVTLDQAIERIQKKEFLRKALEVYKKSIQK